MSVASHRGGLIDRWVSSRRAALIVGVVLLLVSHVVPARAATPATVVGAERVDLRACPRLGCAVIGTAPLGASVAVTGDPTDGFVAIDYQGKIGYVPDVYVATDPEHVPYLTAGRPGCRRIALIFNVGVGDEPATAILDTLKERRVPATMFVMGWWADQHPAALRRMVEDGFLIGSHGYDGIELPLRSDDEVVRDIERTSAAIEHATGAPPTRLFTPYAGAMDERVRAIVATEGYLPVAWSVPTDDYRAEATAEAVYERVVSNAADGAIVELHLDASASASATGVALPRFVDELRQEGYRFVTIPEMIEPCS